MPDAKSFASVLKRHPTRTISRYPSPGMHDAHPFPARIRIKPANASAGYYKQYTTAFVTGNFLYWKIILPQNAQNTDSAGTCGQLLCILTVY